MKTLYLFLLLAFAVTGCHKNVTDEKETCKEGFIIWGQDPSLDGLGWYFAESLSPGAQPYKFDNLPQAYQQDKLPVSICFYETDELFNCFCAVPLPVHHITNIGQKDN